jgi:hypothetical protein
MKEPPLLRVEWVDAEMWSGWQDAEDIQAGLEPIVTYGFRVKEEDGYLYLAHSHNPNPGRWEWAGLVGIPVRAIVKKRRIGH